MSDEPREQDPPDPSEEGSGDADALLDELRDVARRLDPVDEETRLAARSMFAYRDLDAALAELTFDSLLDAPLVAVRSQATTARQLSFDAGAFQIEIEVVAEGDRRRLVGQCVPSGEVEVEVWSAIGPETGATAGGGPLPAEPVARVVADDYGRFVVEVEPGTLRLRCRWPASGGHVDSAWVAL